MSLFEGEHLEWMRTSRPAPISPKDKLQGSPHAWLKITHPTKHAHYDWVSHDGRATHPSKCHES